MKKRFAAIAALVAGVAAATLLPAAAMPAASAKPGMRVRLSALLLPRSTLGSAAQGLRLEHDSGGYVNPGADPLRHNEAELGLPLTPNRSLAVIGPNLATLGRIKGHALDYGLGTSGGAGVTEVWTSVDLYKTSADAANGLAAWRRVDRRVTSFDHRAGLIVAVRAENMAPVGSRRFGFLVHYRAANITPLYGFDEQFTHGHLEADVTVWAGRAAAAEKLAPQLARKLDARIKLALAGRLHAKITVPDSQKAGRPPGGPDLGRLALAPTDLGVQASSWQHGYGLVYGIGSFALAYYQDEIAGQFGGSGQGIEWWATANEASFAADVAAGCCDDTPPVDLSGVGDGARGFLDGSSGAQLLFSSGRLFESVSLYGYSALSTSDVQHIARTVAKKINAAGLRSHARQISGRKEERR